MAYEVSLLSLEKFFYEAMFSLKQYILKGPTELSGVWGDCMQSKHFFLLRGEKKTKNSVLSKEVCNGGLACSLLKLDGG